MKVRVGAVCTFFVLVLGGLVSGDEGLGAHPENVTGIWSMSYTTIYSSCAEEKTSDKQVTVWTLSFNNSTFVVKSSSGADFTGQSFGTDQVTFHPTLRPSGTTVQLQLTSDGKQLSGLRLVSQLVPHPDPKFAKNGFPNPNDPTCVIVEQVQGQKQ